MTRDQRIAINMSCISGLMLIASFLPWGRVASSVASDKFGVGNEAVQGLMGLIGDRIYIPISGWIGSLMIGGVEFLNWLPLVALAAVATLAWLRATGVTRTPHAVLLLLLLYATIQ
jgi:hypothetical protein